MKRIVISEHERIWKKPDKGLTRDNPPGRVYLDSRRYGLLQRFDRLHSKGGQNIFTWYADHAKAMQWVGVIQIGRMQIEILPKIDDHEEAVGSQWGQTRQNLLYMLSVAGDIPIRFRDIASLTIRKAPLNETLCAIFARHLLFELLRGAERTYITQEKNLRTFKGRLIINRHILKNAGHRERFFCRFDKFSDDTIINRVFKATCKILLDTTTTPATQDSLRHCLLILDEVSDKPVFDNHFKLAQFTRQNDRFLEVFNFCRLIHSGLSPTASSGDDRTYSLLFDMNAVFERFIASFIKQKVMKQLPGYEIFPQAKFNRRYLFQSTTGKKILHMAPDILIRDLEGNHLVIDTKWKRLKSDNSGSQTNVSSSDLYQLYAYTHRYGCNQSILLYPRVSGVVEQDYHLLDHNDLCTDNKVTLRLVNLHRNLHSKQEQNRLPDELEGLIVSGFTKKNELHTVTRSVA
ncbi:McrC family protein [bacterium]|nr:McrC family protein [bacterium]